MPHTAMAKTPPASNPQKPARRTANIALHVKLTDEEAQRMRGLAERRGTMRDVVVDGMSALEEQGDLLRQLTEAREVAKTVATQMASHLAQESGASETWKRACSSILDLLKTCARKRALTETELDIWTLAMGESLQPPKTSK